jgi:hypothetical protein
MASVLQLSRALHCRLRFANLLSIAVALHLQHVKHFDDTCPLQIDYKYTVCVYGASKQAVEEQANQGLLQLALGQGLCSHSGDTALQAL